jgi:16S rRNA (guanine(966)-N(2))-methyltransferase RsmD
MRIIAGLSKGRRLKAPKWPGLRPTSDKLRETLFNVVAARVPGARVLDVFAGTGAIGLESLSRGAEHVTFIENDKRAAALIGDNAELCGFQNRCVIIRDTAERALSRPLQGEPFDVIVLDPPYEFEPLERVLSAAARRLGSSAVMILEHASRRVVPQVADLRAVRTIRSGDSALTMFVRRGSDMSPQGNLGDPGAI